LGNSRQSTVEGSALFEIASVHSGSDQLGERAGAHEFLSVTDGCHRSRGDGRSLRLNTPLRQCYLSAARIIDEGPELGRQYDRLAGHGPKKAFSARYCKPKEAVNRGGSALNPLAINDLQPGLLRHEHDGFNRPPEMRDAPRSPQRAALTGYFFAGLSIRTL
jgi:hypothetical protein